MSIASCLSCCFGRAVTSEELIPLREPGSSDSQKKYGSSHDQSSTQPQPQAFDDHLGGNIYAPWDCSKGSTTSTPSSPEKNPMITSLAFRKALDSFKPQGMIVILQSERGGHIVDELSGSGAFIPNALKTSADTAATIYSYVCAEGKEEVSNKHFIGRLDVELIEPFPKLTFTEIQQGMKKRSNLELQANMVTQQSQDLLLTIETRTALFFHTYNRVILRAADRPAKAECSEKPIE